MNGECLDAERSFRGELILREVGSGDSYGLHELYMLALNAGRDFCKFRVLILVLLYMYIDLFINKNKPEH